MRLSEKQLSELLQKRAGKTLQSKPNKYRAKKIVIDGITFHSIAEGKYYEHLKLLVKLGVVKYFLRQVPFHLPGKSVYRLDFLVVYSDGVIEYIDVKGFVTALFKMKLRQVESLYPVKIKLVFKNETD